MVTSKHQHNCNFPISPRSLRVPTVDRRSSHPLRYSKSERIVDRLGFSRNTTPKRDFCYTSCNSLRRPNSLGSNFRSSSSKNNLRSRLLSSSSLSQNNSQVSQGSCWNVMIIRVLFYEPSSKILLKRVTPEQRRSRYCRLSRSNTNSFRSECKSSKKSCGELFESFEKNSKSK